MHLLAPRYEARAVEAESRAFWGARSLPPVEGPMGPSSGALTRLVTGPVPVGAPHLAAAMRLVRMDAEGRILAGLGRRAYGNLRVPLHAPEGIPDDSPDPARELGVWIGGGRLRSPVARESELLRTLIERLADEGLLATRSEPVRVCPRCIRPHSPESLVYQEEEGSAYLVRFRLEGEGTVPSLLVWTDAAWKLLATTALLVGPTTRYVTAIHRRRGSEERVICSQGSLSRLAEWLPESTFEVIEERPGSELATLRYVHPLATEHPAVANLPAPGGTLVSSPDVVDSGTGILTLTPTHGVADAEVAKLLEIPGWPVVGVDGVLTRTVQHKYAGLELEDAEAFILRDLIDDGSIFAQIPVRRGVPRCSTCGSTLLWTPSRLWSLLPARLPPERVRAVHQVLPGADVAGPEESVSWPVSELAEAPPDEGIALAECDRCDRLALDTASATCVCGGSRTVVRRRLLPEFEEALATWATVETFPDGTAVRLFLPERRRAPALIHQVTAQHAARRRPGELRLVPILSLPTAGPALGTDEPVDALRSALLRTVALPAGRASLEGHRREESVRLRRIWTTAAAVLSRYPGGVGNGESTPIASSLGTLLEEDRAFLSVFERMRLEVLRAYEKGEIASGLERLLRFFDHDLRRGYLRLVAPRLGLVGAPPPKQSALRLLAHIFPGWVQLYAPAAPFTAEALWRAFRGDSGSVFEEPYAPVVPAFLNPEAEAEFARWRSVVDAVDRSRARFHIPRGARLPAVVVHLEDEDEAGRLQISSAVLGRLLATDSLAIASPAHPWEGRKFDVRPNLTEIQRAFGLQAPRILRMIEGLPARRVHEGLRAGSISLALEGNSVTILPTMLETTEALPPETVPIPWARGEIFLKLPPGATEDRAHPAPRLSLDAYRFLRAAEHRLHSMPVDMTVPEIVIGSEGTLAQELSKQAVPIARYLHLPRIRPLTPEDHPPEAELTRGRTGRGVPWSIWIPGHPRPAPAPKSPRRPSGARRAPLPPVAPVVGEADLEFLSEPLRERERMVLELLERLDSALSVPILGPTKLTGLWELGIRTPEQIAHAPFESIAGLRGFGPYIAAELVRAVGGSPPSLPPAFHPRPRALSVSVPVSGTRIPPGSSGVAAEVPAALGPSPSASVPAILTSMPPVPPPTGLPNLGTAGQSLADIVRPAPVNPPVSRPVEVVAAPPRPTETAPSEAEIPEGALPPVPSIDASKAIPSPAPAPVPPPSADPGLGEAEESVDARAPEVPASPSEETEPESEEIPLSEDPELESATAQEPVLPADPQSTESDLLNANAPAGGESALSAPVPEVATEPLGETPNGGLPGSSGPIEASGPEPESSPLATRSGAGPEPPAGPLPAVPGDEPSVADAGSDPSSSREGPLPLEPLDAGGPEPATAEAPVEGRSDPLGTDPAPGFTEPAALVTAADETPSMGEAPVVGASETGPSVAPIEEPMAPPAPAIEVAMSRSTEVADPEPPHPSAAESPPPPSRAPEDGIHLALADSGESPWDKFLEATAAGHRGLCLTREFPDRIRLYLGNRIVEVVWISSVARHGSLRPSDLEGIRQSIQGAIAERGITAVYFEGVEYLVSIHSAERVRGVLDGLDTEARARHARIWIPVNRDLLPGPELERLLAVAPPS